MKSARSVVPRVFVAMGSFMLSTAAEAQVAPPPQVCAAADPWFACARKVKTAIKSTSDFKVALAAASEWAVRYDVLYKAHARDTWTWDDQVMLQQLIEKLYDEALGKYLDPASLAFGLALAKYLPKLAAALEFAGGAAVTGFIVLLAPSPVANDFTEAGTDNKEINALIMSKMPPTTLSIIQQRYPDLFNKSFTEVQSRKKVNKP
ncbi:MAG: hypothetical protein EON58_15625 [Alphaproteobacteria bacterium]|nr:MAG: hypothetical protein EON58_15625 [Alphaproteobacteria bacterium]